MDNKQKKAHDKAVKTFAERVNEVRAFNEKYFITNTEKTSSLVTAFKRKLSGQPANYSPSASKKVK